MQLQLIKAHPAWDIPSFDPASIEAELFVLLASQRMQATAAPTTNTLRHTIAVSPYSSSPASPSGVLPVVINGSQVYPAETVIADLQSNWHNFDSALTPAQREEASVYRAAASSSLTKALLFLESQAPSSEFAAHAPSLLARFRLRRARAAAVSAALAAAQVTSMSSAATVAVDAFHALATRLGSSAYYFGTDATAVSSLDITSAAYITVCAFGYPDQLNPLAAVLRSFYPSLLAHAHRVMALANIPNYTVTMELSLICQSRVSAAVAAIQTDAYAMRLPTSAEEATPDTTVVADPDSVDDSVEATTSVVTSSKDILLPYKAAALEWILAQIATSGASLCWHSPSGGTASGFADPFGNPQDASAATTAKSNTASWRRRLLFLTYVMGAYIVTAKLAENHRQSKSKA